jgi:hypothetical protein
MKTWQYIATGLVIFTLTFSGSAFLDAGSTDNGSLSTPPIAHAQVEDSNASSTFEQEYEGDYNFLAPLPIPGFGGSDDTIDAASTSSFPTYVNTVIQVGIGIAIVLAIIMVMIGGVEYMFSGSVTKKSDAKNRIQQAVGGLVLALSAVVILQTINPNLIELNTLKTVNTTQEEIGTPSLGNQGWCWQDVALGDWDCFDTYSQCTDGFNGGAAATGCYYFTGASHEVGEYNYSGEPSEGYCVQVYNSVNDGYEWYCGNTEEQCSTIEDKTRNKCGDDCIEQSCQFKGEPGNENNEESAFKSNGTVLNDKGSILEDVVGTSTDSKGVAKQKCRSEANEIKKESPMCEPENGKPCSIEGCDSADSLQNEFQYACPRGEDDFTDSCSFSERLSCEDCGSLKDSLSFTPSDYYRPDPRVCHEKYGISDNWCQINNDLAGKIDTLESNLDIPWTLNEAWPPTIRHKSECHAKGTCVDIALRQETRQDGTPITPYPNDPLNQNVAEHAQRINTFFEAAENAGLTIKYEVGNQDLMEQLIAEGVPNGKIISIGVAPHFSVYRSQSDM